MTSAYPDSIILERYNGADWVVISGVISDYDIDDIGIQTPKFEDRLASAATLKFEVRNEDGQYDVDIDFKRKTPLRLTINYMLLSKVFYFYVTKAIPSDTTYLETISVQATDWMGLAILDLLRHVPVGQNQRIDQAITTLLAYISNQPQHTDFDIGVETFQIVFDAIYNGKTSVYAELYNFIISELGYMYLRNNETLVIENATARNGLLTASPYYYDVMGDESFALNDSNDGFLLSDDGGKIILGNVMTESLPNEFPRLANTPFSKAIERETGENVLNKIIMQVQPRQVDLSVGAYYQVYTYNLYNENPSILVRGGGAITVLEGPYPEDGAGVGKTPDAAMEVSTPSTGMGGSFFVFSIPAGSLVHTFVAGADSWKWTIQNNGADGYITEIELFGRPIFRQQPLSYTAEDTDSQEEYGTKSGLYNLVYRQNINSAIAEAEALLAKEKDSKTITKSISFCANLSNAHMVNFMLSDMGDYRHLVSASLGIDEYHFIQGMKIQIQPQGMIYHQLKLKQKEYNLTPLSIRLSGVAGSQNVVNFGSISRLANLTQKTISLRLYPRGVSLSAIPMLTKYGDTSGGWELWVLGVLPAVIGMVQYNHNFTGGMATWQTPANTITPLLNTWVHIFITYDLSSTANDPSIYVNNVLQALTEVTAPSGTPYTDVSSLLRLGNRYNLIYDAEASIKHVRIYNRILDSTDRAAIYNDPTDDPSIVPDFIFRMPNVLSEDIASYIGQPITPSMKIIESTNLDLGTVGYSAAVGGEVKGETA